MKKVPCKLSDFRFFPSGVSLDVSLEQVDQITVVAGDRAVFNCTVTGGDLRKFRMSWYKKSEDNALILVYKLNNNSTEDLMGNFKGKIDISESRFILDIQKATMKDAGTYYCGTDIHSAAVTASNRFKTKSRIGQTKAADPMSDHLRLNSAPHVRWDLLIALTVASDKRDWSGVGARPDF